MDGPNNKTLKNANQYFSHVITKIIFQKYKI